MYHFFKKQPIYDKKSGKEIPIPVQDDHLYRYAFINDQVISYDSMSEKRFPPEHRNMKYLGYGEILYQTSRPLSLSNSEDQMFARIIITVRKLGYMNIKVADMLQKLKNNNKIDSYVIEHSRIQIQKISPGCFIIEG